MPCTFASSTSAIAASEPARFPSHTRPQFPSTARHGTRPETLEHTMSTLPVNSSAPQQSTSTRPRQKHTPPTSRCTAKGSVASERNVQKNMPPNPMNAPASIAETKHLPIGRAAFAHAASSTRFSTSVGEKASNPSPAPSCIAAT